MNKRISLELNPTYKPREGTRSLPSVAKFFVKLDGTLILHAYLYGDGRWWVTTPGNEPLIPKKLSDGLTWNADVSDLTAFLEGYIARTSIQLLKYKAQTNDSHQ